MPPTFLIEEMLHRNALFTIRHAVAMPKRRASTSLEVTDLGDGLRAVDAVFRNEHLIPTRSARAAEVKRRAHRRASRSPARASRSWPGAWRQ